MLGCICAFSACNEDRLEPANTDTFIKMYGDSNYPLTAVDARLHPDGGFILLANAEYLAAEVAAYMPKIIKADKNGNIEWQWALETGRNEISYALEIAGTDSYLIAGKHINKNKDEFMLVKTNNEGTIVNRFTKQFTEPSAAKAVTVLKNGNYFVVGEVGTTRLRSYVIELSPDFTEISSRLFDDSKISVTNFNNSKTSMSNKVFENSSEQVFWTGIVDNGIIKGNITGYTPGGLVETDTEVPLGKNTPFQVNSFYSLSGGNNFAFLGTYLDGDETDIKFMHVSGQGYVFSESDFDFDVLGGNDLGASITQSSDGAFLALSTSEKTGHGTDFMLLKIDGSNGQNKFAEPLFFGGENNETAATVLSTPDGGILMFGTTVFANANILITIKTDINGEL